MSRLLWALAGLCGGVVVSRNAAPMGTPVMSAVILGAILLFVLGWWSGNRDRASAVATAVATAFASANVEVDVNTKAEASSAINIYLGGELVRTISGLSQLGFDNHSERISDVQSAGMIEQRSATSPTIVPEQTWTIPG